MNILFIHEVNWLNKVVFDIHSLSESLSLLGHHVYAIDYAGDSGSLKTSEIDGVSRAFPGASVTLVRPGLIRVPGLGRLSASLTHYLEIRNVIKTKAIDAIVLYSVPTNGLQTLFLARKFRIPVIFRSLDILNQLTPVSVLRPVTKFLEKRVYSRSDMILTLTPKLSDYVVNYGAKPFRVQLLPMPVDTGLFHPSIDSSAVRQKWGLSKEDDVILFMGTLFDFSGLDVFIPRFADVIKEMPQAKLLIVGDGPQRPKLEAIISDLGLQQQVTITGFQPYETMPQYINLAAICINTFHITEATRDIFPGKTVQFLACGKALIATALPGMQAIIPNELQGVVYADNAAEVATKLITLLKSPERRKQVERNGLNYVIQAHGYDKIARQLEACLEQSIKEKQHGKPLK
ncbi:MAG: glycosyltransferase [Chloroflexi bacterium]|nr:glycosyltransferase [Chloroflexota bacterium]